MYTQVQFKIFLVTDSNPDQSNNYAENSMHACGSSSMKARKLCLYNS